MQWLSKLIDEMDERWDAWWIRNLAEIIAGACCVIVLVALAGFVMSVQTAAINARLASEVKDLKVQQLTDRAMIRALADEQAWVRNSVKIQTEITK